MVSKSFGELCWWDGGQDLEMILSDEVCAIETYLHKGQNHV
jgi:hypothetical protein